MSMVVNIETLKEVTEAMRAFTDDPVDLNTGESMLTKFANKVEEQRKKLDEHESTKAMAKNLENLATRARQDTIVMRDVVETLNKIIEIIEQHETKATAKISGKESSE